MFVADRSIIEPHSDTPSVGVITAVAAPASNCFSGMVFSPDYAVSYQLPRPVGSGP
jgi:hypothetical protein